MRGIGRDALYFYPSLWIAQRCVPVELLEYIVDLDIKVRVGWVNENKNLP